MAKTGTIVAIIVILVVIVGLIFLINPGKEAETTETSTGETEETDETTPQEHTIEVTSAGFSPQTLTIKAGDTVTWVNKGPGAMWPASAGHPTHKVYPVDTGKCVAIGGSDFDACTGLGVGRSYSFAFDEVGSWNYHNHMRPSNTGTVVVE